MRRLLAESASNTQNLIPTGERRLRASDQLKRPNPGCPDQLGTRRKPNNVLTQALRLGVPVWVAPLVAPAVDLSILGLLLWHPAPCPAWRDAGTAPARSPIADLRQPCHPALNVSEPIVTGDYGKAAFDSVGPLLLIGWAEKAAKACCKPSRPSPFSHRDCGPSLVISRLMPTLASPP
jgi:hypothetical protein